MPHDDNKKKTGSRRSRPPAAKTDPMLRSLEKFVVEEIEVADIAPARSARPVKARSRWLPALRRALSMTMLALIAVLAGLVTRNAWPGDETRWLAMAWEMWAHGDWLVPHLNGVTTGVPPLFLWVVRAGWSVFGAVEWWPRLVPALFMLGSLFLAMHMARFLWPGQGDVVRQLPYVQLGSFYWVWSATFLTPDMLTVFFVLLAATSLLWMWRKRDQRVWLLLGLAFGLGLLASGSIVFFYVVPVALLAPLWTRGTPVMPWKYWYIDIAKASIMGFVLFAIWALPAAARAKVATIAPLLTAPVTLHTLDLFPGVAPWWWYLFLLPLAALPWSLWPLPWMRFWQLRSEPTSNGLMFCVLWSVPVIALLSLFGVKQPQFLLPLVPAFFLAAAWLLLDEAHARHEQGRLASTMIFPLLLLGGLLAVLPKLPRVEFLPEFLWQLSPFVGVGVIGVGVAVSWLPIPSLETRIKNIAATVVVLTALVLLITGWQLNPGYELSGAARVIEEAQRHDQAVGHVGSYAGQFHFAGRLGKPIEVLAPGQVGPWLSEHPDGLLVTYADGWQPPVPAGSKPFYEQPYGASTLRLWTAGTLKRAEPAAAPAPAGIPSLP
jgi:4-amino-4-deoxy-L-arabinose transferase-like glycosyltransferase